MTYWPIELNTNDITKLICDVIYDNDNCCFDQKNYKSWIGYVFCLQFTQGVWQETTLPAGLW